MEINLPSLKLLIKKHGLTHDDVARTLDVSRPSITNKLRGTQPFTHEELSALAERLGVTVEDVATGKKRANREDQLWDQLEWARKESVLKQQTIDELKSTLAEYKQTINELRAMVEALQTK